MAASEKKARLSNWLDNLQQESWQLELIISGVVIFLMLGAYGPIMDIQPLLTRNYLTGGGFFIVIAGGYAIFLVAYFALLIIFIIHLVLRGFWIGAIGLRSVSGYFDYDILDYQPKFNGWLRGQLGSFDDYIERLEMQCSVAFSFAFLIFFSVLSVGLFTLVIAGATFGMATALGANFTSTPYGSNRDYCTTCRFITCHGADTRLPLKNMSLLPPKVCIGEPRWRSCLCVEAKVMRELKTLFLLNAYRAGPQVQGKFNGQCYAPLLLNRFTLHLRPRQKMNIPGILTFTSKESVSSKISPAKIYHDESSTLRFRHDWPRRHGTQFSP